MVLFWWIPTHIIYLQLITQLKDLKWNPINVPLLNNGKPYFGEILLTSFTYDFPHPVIKIFKTKSTQPYLLTPSSQSTDLLGPFPL